MTQLQIELLKVTHTQTKSKHRIVAATATIHLKCVYFRFALLCFSSGFTFWEGETRQIMVNAASLFQAIVLPRISTHVFTLFD